MTEYRVWCTNGGVRDVFYMGVLDVFYTRNQAERLLTELQASGDEDANPDDFFIQEVD